MLIAIGGISRAGKSSLSKILAQSLGKNGMIIHQDHYIKENIHWQLFTRPPWCYLAKLHKKFNMEHPEVIDFEKLYTDIAIAISKCDYVIAEGFAITFDKRIRKMIDAYVHITLSKETFLRRRTNDFKKANTWYAHHVWDVFNKHGNDYADLNHLVVDGEYVESGTVTEFVTGIRNFHECSQSV